jgi:hypothetical protein
MAPMWDYIARIGLVVKLSYKTHRRCQSQTLAEPHRPKVRFRGPGIRDLMKTPRRLRHESARSPHPGPTVRRNGLCDSEGGILPRKTSGSVEGYADLGHHISRKAATGRRKAKRDFSRN